MNRPRLTFVVLFTLLLAGAGCARRYPPPPPPPPVATESPLVRSADRNGFEIGRLEGESDAANGQPFHARRSHAFHAAPGYDPQLGPFLVYRETFRNAYLRGYYRGFYRR